MRGLSVPGEKYPGVRLRNFSRSGADSCEVAGAGHGCQDTVPRVSQLVAADAFLKHIGDIFDLSPSISAETTCSSLPSRD